MFSSWIRLSSVRTGTAEIRCGTRPPPPEFREFQGLRFLAMRRRMSGSASSADCACVAGGQSGLEPFGNSGRVPFRAAFFRSLASFSTLARSSSVKRELGFGDLDLAVHKREVGFRGGDAVLESFAAGLQVRPARTAIRRALTRAASRRHLAASRLVSSAAFWTASNLCADGFLRGFGLATDLASRRSKLASEASGGSQSGVDRVALVEQLVDHEDGIRRRLLESGPGGIRGAALSAALRASATELRFLMARLVVRIICSRSRRRSSSSSGVIPWGSPAAAPGASRRARVSRASWSQVQGACGCPRVFPAGRVLQAPREWLPFSARRSGRGRGGEGMLRDADDGDPAEGSGFQKRKLHGRDELLGLDDRELGFFPGENAALDIADIGESEFDEGCGSFGTAASAAAVNQQRLGRIEFFRRAGGEILVRPRDQQRLDKVARQATPPWSARREPGRREWRQAKWPLRQASQRRVPRRIR